MDEFKRYAIYWAPEPGSLADAAAFWLGWDPVAACAVPQPDLPGLPRPLTDLTADARKYGFHGTIKAPFRLADGMTRNDVSVALAQFCTRTGPVILPMLVLTQIEGFLALTPHGDGAALNDLAGRVVTALDVYRAPLTPQEIARRRPEALTERQRELLMNFGYPYVLEQFQFHLTLSGSLADAEVAAMWPYAERLFQPLLPRPFCLDGLCLFGEDHFGQFHLLGRHALTG